MIDKLKIYTDDFKVSDNACLTIQPSTFRYNDKENNQESFLFIDNKGKSVAGAKAYYNNTDENLPYSVNLKGGYLSVEFNPAKAMYGNNFYSITNQQLEPICDKIYKDIKGKGIDLNFAKMKLSRIDLAKNYKMLYGYECYSQVFGVLQAKRMKSSSYPTYYSFRNKSREIVFYDKLQELKEVQKVHIGIKGNILRNELRFRNSKTTQNNLHLTEINELFLKDNYEHLKTVYRNTVLDIVFKNTKIDLEKVKRINFDRERELLEICKVQNKRNVINEYVSLIGLNGLLERHGSIENFKSFLNMAGFTRKYIYTVTKKIEGNLNLLSKVDKKYKNNDSLACLYGELYEKIKKAA